MLINKIDKDIPIENREPIVIYVYSYGGEVSVCFNLIDIITLSKTPIITVNMGIAMSAGLFIFLAGQKRMTLKHAQALIHSGSGGTGGTYEQTKAQMENYDKMIIQLRDFLLERTKIDTKLYNKMKSKEWYLTANEQVEYGIADKVIISIDEIV